MCKCQQKYAYNFACDKNLLSSLTIVLPSYIGVCILEQTREYIFSGHKSFDVFLYVNHLNVDILFNYPRVPTIILCGCMTEDIPGLLCHTYPSLYRSVIY